MMTNLPDGYYLYKPDEKFGGALVRVRDGRYEILLMQGMEMLTVIRKNHIQPLRLEPVEPDAPITPAALREAGWKRTGIWREDERIPSLRLPLTGPNHDSLHWDGEYGVQLYLSTGAIAVFPGCRSMSDLRALVAMLGGAD